MDNTEEIEQELRQLKQIIDEMRGQFARLQSDISRGGAEPASRSRRGFLRMGAGALLGAVGVAVARAVPASATNGGNLILGAANTAESPTTLAGDSGTPIPVFSAAAQATTWNPPTTGTFAGPLQGLGTSGSTEGVDGWASGPTGYAVYGLTDQGYGVVGQSSTGIGLYARASGRLRQEGLANAGLPAYTPNNFEQVRDANGVLWIHNTSGSWRRVNTPRFDASNGSGSPFKPFRRLDTRSGLIKAVGSVTTVTIAPSGSGVSAIPADAIAVIGNLTAVAYTGTGFLAIMPAGMSIGTAANQYNPSSDPSSVNFILGQYAIANSFVCGLSAAGALQVYVGGHPAHFIIDITGYIQ